MVNKIRVRQKTKDLKYIRRMIRDAIRWHKVDNGMPEFYKTDDFRRARLIIPGTDPKAKFYYTKSSRAIEEIAKKIYEKIK